MSIEARSSMQMNIKATRNPATKRAVSVVEASGIKASKKGQADQHCPTGSM
jgi:hypothetical protein